MLTIDNLNAVTIIEFMMGLVTTIRTLRSELGIHPAIKTDLIIVPKDDFQFAVIWMNVNIITDLIRVDKLYIQRDGVRVEF